MNWQQPITTGCSSKLEKALDGLHEISQPLATLCLGLYLLEEAANDKDERERLLSSIQDQCNRAVRGVQHLRDLLESSMPMTPGPHALEGRMLRGKRVDA